ncbi:unnamed protein product [Effrenium voratum]|uniref:Protein kinase domain-containing protein n=1 Tax=Effrenium voratum TaxID=2562239 RepID=A0AA36J8T3_9DINO|nr:unnamed protein product [Effrenium voratum]
MARAFTLGRAPCALSGLGHLVSPEVPRRAPAGPVAAVATCLHVRQRMGRGGGKGKGSGKGKGAGSQKPTDDPNFVRWSKNMRLQGSPSGAVYVVEDYVASGSFSRVFRVHEAKRWGERRVYAAKVMRKEDSYIQYTSSGPKEGELLMRLEAAQAAQEQEVLTMRCLDSFATKDDAGQEYWCLILEWLDASLFDIVRANGHRGLHLSMVRILLRQLLEQLKVLQELKCTHTDIKHKNCCLANTEHYLAPSSGGPTIILTQPLAKFIDYGNAVFEGDKKPHPIHTKQFRAPEVLLNVRMGWGPASDTWTLGVTAAFLVSGQLIFNSHDPTELLRLMRQALGPFPARLLAAAQDNRMRKAAELAEGGVEPQLGSWLNLAGKGPAEAACADLLLRMLALDPGERLSAEEALRHTFIADGGDGEKAPIPPKTSELRYLGAS